MESEGIKRLVVSFSFGETSAYLVKLASEGCFSEYDDIIYVSANTGEEKEESLIFGERVNQEFIGGSLVWLEAVVNHDVRESCGHKIVSFDSAHRGGDIFREMSMKYGIPNASYPHCTRSLKLDPINSYLRSIGWDYGTYHTAIGIRKDESDRMSSKSKERGLIYPLVSRYPMKKSDINYFWSRHHYRLELKGYEGNCKWCWKKTDRKLFTLAQDDPSIFNLPRELEREYSLCGSNKDGKRRKIFRKNRSTDEILEEAKKPFVRYHDENTVYTSQFELDLDIGGGCGESCEIYADE